MTFLNPLLLAGLFLAVIPLVIHLFNFRRPRKIDFSSLEFVQELKKTTMQKVRVKQWLLLLLRTLALISIGLVFARPSLDSRLASIVGGDARTTVGVIVDNSLSMTLRDANGGYLEQSRALASDLASEMESGDEFVMMSLSSATIASYVSANAAQAGIQSIELAPSKRSLVHAATEMVDVLRESDAVNKELYVVTDGQRTAYGDSAIAENTDRISGYLLRVGNEPPANIGISSIEVTSRIIEAGQPAVLVTTVDNYGETAVDGYVVSAFLNDERVAQATVDIPANAAATVELTITPRNRGWLRGEIRLEDDAFESDNVRHFVLNVPDQRDILLVRGNNQSVDYLASAVNAGNSDGRALFATRTINESSLAVTKVEDYHVVFLVGVEDLSSGEINLLSTFVSAGGGLVIFPSRTASIADYNGLLNQLQGGRVEGFIGEVNSGTTVTRLQSFEPSHPLFEGIFDATSTGDIEKPEVYFGIDYRPTRGSESTLMSLSNGKPLLQELKSGSGSTLVFTVLPDPQWSDLPVRGLFVPLIFRSMYYLSSSNSGGFQELVAGRDGEVVIPASVGQDIVVRASNGSESNPVVRSVSGGLQVSLTARENVTGVSEILSDSAVVGMIPINNDPLESDLIPLSGDEGAEFLGDATGVTMRSIDVSALSSTDLENMVTTARTGVELWRPLLLAGLIFLIVEMLVARFWSPEST